MVVTYEPHHDVPAGLNLPPEVAFPEIRVRTMEDLLMDLTGRLEAMDGCLRIVPPAGGPGYLIIWQPGYFLNDNQGNLEVWDSDGKVVARVGQEITLGMGGLPGGILKEIFLREPLPAQCPEPYWLMSGIRVKP